MRHSVVKAFWGWAWTDSQHEPLTHPRVLCEAHHSNNLLSIVTKSKYYFSENVVTFLLSSHLIFHRQRDMYAAALVCFMFILQNFVTLCCYFCTSDRCSYCFANNERRSCLSCVFIVLHTNIGHLNMRWRMRTERVNPVCCSGLCWWGARQSF